MQLTEIKKTNSSYGKYCFKDLDTQKFYFSFRKKDLIKTKSDLLKKEV